MQHLFQKATRRFFVEIIGRMESGRQLDLGPISGRVGSVSTPGSGSYILEVLLDQGPMEHRPTQRLPSSTEQEAHAIGVAAYLE